MTIAGGEVSLPVSRPAGDGAEDDVRGSRLREVVLAANKETDKFGVEGVPVVLKPGVMVEATDVRSTSYPAEFNPAHTKYIARSEKAKPMAVNMYSAFWTLCVCLLVTIVVSLFTRPKSDAELKNLVMGLTPLPDEGPCPWYQQPLLWATVVAAVLVAINIFISEVQLHGIRTSRTSGSHLVLRRHAAADLRTADLGAGIYAL